MSQSETKESISAMCLRAPDGSEIPESILMNEKHHFWVFGPSGTHKTLWFRTQVLKRYLDKCFNGCFPLDKYCGEKIIYWDDTVPALHRLLYFSTIPGILVIVISAKSIDDTFADQQTREQLHTGFIEYDMELEVNQNFLKPCPL